MKLDLLQQDYACFLSKSGGEGSNLNVVIDAMRLKWAKKQNLFMR